jgi:hypothetical protein
VSIWGSQPFLLSSTFCRFRSFLLAFRSLGVRVSGKAPLSPRLGPLAKFGNDSERCSPLDGPAEALSPSVCMDGDRRTDGGLMPSDIGNLDGEGGGRSRGGSCKSKDLGSNPGNIYTCTSAVVFGLFVLLLGARKACTCTCGRARGRTRTHTHTHDNHRFVNTSHPWNNLQKFSRN